MSVKGVLFADAWINRTSGDFDGVTGHVISRGDLIANKRAVGRPQDLVDLESLLKSEPGDGGVPGKPKPKGNRAKGRDPDLER